MSKRRGSGDPMLDGGSVDRFESCGLEVVDEPWPFAAAQRAAIDAHWQARTAANPAFFNGIVHVLCRQSHGAGRFSAAFRQVEFKSFLYWRDHGYPEAGVRDGFGSALIRSAEGHVLLGRQGGGHLNSGLAYLPGGFIDPRDVDEQGRVDIEASVRRELLEETGLGPADLERVPGVIVTRAGPHVSIAVELRSPLAAEALRSRILTHLGRVDQSELVDIVVVRGGDELRPEEMPVFTAVLLRELFR